MKRAIRASALTALASSALFITPGGVPEAGAAVAASLTGTWTVTMETPRGTRETTWTLEQHEDDTLTGTVGGMQGEVGIEGGWVKDDSFGFMVVRSMGERTFEATYEGTFTENELSGTMTAGGGQFTAEFTGVRAEGGSR